VKQLDPKIFKAYDIRGIYPKQLNEEDMYKIGRAYVQFLREENPDKELNIVVGRDMRLSSPALSESLIKGIIDSGANVIDIGLTSTPTFYFAVASLGYDGGMQVSASHNPPEWNGIKAVRARAYPIGLDTGFSEIRDIALKGDFPECEKGTIIKKEKVLQEAVKYSMNYYNFNIKPMKVVVDVANAMGSLDIEALFKELPCELIKMNFDLDGTFPVHQADPMQAKNVEDLKKKVLEENADLGIAVDGDADRFFFVDNKGELIEPGITRGLISRYVLKQNPGATIGYDIRPGRITRDMIEDNGGKPFVTRVGHSLIKAKSIEENAVFSGESSGHFMLNTSHGAYEVPMIVILRILEFISEKNMPVSEIMKLYDRYFNSGEINSKVEDPDEKIRLITEEYNQGKTLFLDGVDIFYPDFWFVVRKSNTEPLLRLVLEANTKEIMEEKRDELLRLIRE